MSHDIMKATGLPIGLQDMTLQELVESCTEFSVKGNEVRMKKDTPDGIFSLKYKKYENGYCMQQSMFNNAEQKKEYKRTIHSMKKEGMTQQDIAHILNMSQSYVSRLLREGKK